MRTILAAEIGYKDATVSPNTTGTFYMGSEGFVTDPGDTLPNEWFSGRIDGDVTYRVRLATAFWGGNSSIGIGSIELINDDGGLDGWRSYEFRDQPIVLKQHTVGASYDSATVLINAIIEKVTIVGESRLRFVIRDPTAPLVVPITTAAYDNTTDAEGVLKPIAFGQPELCRPILIDEDTLEYHVSDTALQQIVTVYDQGVPVDFNPVAYGFQLVSAPTGKVTATVLSSGTGDDPTLTPSSTEYELSGEGRSISMFDTSPETSLEYGFSDIALSRASSSGGKYYFEMYIDEIPWRTSDPNRGFWGDTIEYGEVACGIQTAAISNPQPLKTSTLYAMAYTTYYSVGTGWRSNHYYANGSAIDSDGVFSASDNVNGKTVGVKVDFDALTIEFLIDNANPDASYGPHSFAAGTYFPVLGASSNGRSDYGNTASIKLIETDFTYAIPSGYTAWASGITPDSTFSKFTESITDRISGVTFDSTSVTAIDGLVHSSPETPYTYSYHLDHSVTGSNLLTWGVAGIGGYWFINRLGNVQVGQLTAPGTSVRTIDDVQITRDITIEQDVAPDLSNGIGALRNWSPYRESEVSGSATELFKQQITRDYQSEYRSSNIMSSSYDHADGAELPMSLLSDSTAAQTEVDRLTALYTTERSFYRVPIAMNAIDFDNAIDDIGSTYTIDSDRYGLSGGVDLVLIGVDGAFLKNELILILWG